MASSTGKESLMKQYLQSFQQLPMSNIYTRKTTQENASSPQKMPRPRLPPITHNGQERYKWKYLHDSYMWTLARTYSVKNMRRCVRNRYMDILLHEGSKGFHSPHTIRAYAGSISTALYKDSSRMIQQNKTPDQFDILFKRKSKSHSTDKEGGATSDNNTCSKLDSTQNSSVVRTNARRQIPRIKQQNTGKGNSETNVSKLKPEENLLQSNNPTAGKDGKGRRRKYRENLDREKCRTEKEQGSEKEELEGETQGKEEVRLINISNSSLSSENTCNRTDFPRGLSERNICKGKYHKRRTKDEMNSTMVKFTEDVEKEKHPSSDNGSKVNDSSVKDEDAERRGGDENTREVIRQGKKKGKLKKKLKRDVDVPIQHNDAVGSQLPEYSQRNDNVVEQDMKTVNIDKTDINSKENIDSYSNNIDEEKTDEPVVRHWPTDVNKPDQEVSVQDGNAGGGDDIGNGDSLSSKTKREKSKVEVKNYSCIDSSTDINETNQFLATKENGRESEEENLKSDHEDVKSDLMHDASLDNGNADLTRKRFSPQETNVKVDDNVSEASTRDLRQIPEQETSESKINVSVIEEKSQFSPRGENESNIEETSDSVLDKNAQEKYIETDTQNSEILDDSPLLNDTSAVEDNDDVNRRIAYYKEDTGDIQEREKETKTRGKYGAPDNNETGLAAERLTESIDITDVAPTDNENGRSDGNLPDKTTEIDSMSNNVILDTELSTEETYITAEVMDSDIKVSNDVDIDNDTSKHSDGIAATATATTAAFAINNDADTAVNEKVKVTKVVDEGNISNVTDGDLANDTSEYTETVIGGGNFNTAVTDDNQHSTGLGDVTPDSVSSSHTNVDPTMAMDSLDGNDIACEDGVGNENSDKKKSFAESELNDKSSSSNTRNGDDNENTTNEILYQVSESPIIYSSKESNDIPAVNVTEDFSESVGNKRAEAGLNNNTLENISNGGDLDNSQSKEQISNGEGVDNFIDDGSRTLERSAENWNQPEDSFPTMTTLADNSDRKLFDENRKIDESDNILDTVRENIQNDEVIYNKHGELQKENDGEIEVSSDTVQNKSEIPDMVENSSDVVTVADTEDNIQNITEKETSPRGKNAIGTNTIVELDNMTSGSDGLIAASNENRDQRSSSRVEEDDNNDDVDGDRRGNGDGDGDGDKRDDVIERSRETIGVTKDNNETNYNMNIAEYGSTKSDVGGNVGDKQSTDGGAQSTITDLESAIKDGIYIDDTPTIRRSATEYSETNGSTVAATETTAKDSGDNSGLSGLNGSDTRDGGDNTVSREVAESIAEDGGVNKVAAEVTGSNTLGVDDNMTAVVVNESTIGDDEVSNVTSGVTEKSTVEDSINIAPTEVTGSNTLGVDDNMAAVVVNESTIGDDEVSNVTSGVTEKSTVEDSINIAPTEVTGSNTLGVDDNMAAVVVNESTIGDDDVSNVTSGVTEKSTVEDSINIAPTEVTGSTTVDDTDNKTVLGVTEYSTVDGDDINATPEVTENIPRKSGISLHVCGVTETTPRDVNVNNDVVEVTEGNTVDSGDATVVKRVTESIIEYSDVNNKSKENMDSTTRNEDISIVPPIIADSNNGGDGGVDVSVEGVRESTKEVTGVSSTAKDIGSISDDRNIN